MLRYTYVACVVRFAGRLMLRWQSPGWLTLFWGNKFLQNELAIKLSHPEDGANALPPKR